MFREKKKCLYLKFNPSQITECREIKAMFKNNGCTCFNEDINKSHALTNGKIQKITSERFESCLQELKEVRETNLLLRKTEGEYQSKIVKLEDDM